MRLLDCDCGGRNGFSSAIELSCSGLRLAGDLDNNGQGASDRDDGCVLDDVSGTGSESGRNEAEDDKCGNDAESGVGSDTAEDDVVSRAGSEFVIGAKDDVNDVSGPGREAEMTDVCDAGERDDVSAAMPGNAEINGGIEIGESAELPDNA